MFTCFPDMNSPVFPSLDDIYCTKQDRIHGYRSRASVGRGSYKKAFLAGAVIQKTSLTVSGQNKIGRELTLLALIQPTVIKQQAVNNNWL